jgi:hypothetical protein
LFKIENINHFYYNFLVPFNLFLGILKHFNFILIKIFCRKFRKNFDLKIKIIYNEVKKYIKFIKFNLFLIPFNLNKNT